jgi:histidyl-tRNA synthetase
VFELVPAREGSQVTVLAGGRYDGLIEDLGGPPTPGIGFGMGLERIAINLREQDLAPGAGTGPRVVVVTLGEGTSEVGARLAARLRRAGVSATMTYGGRSMKAQMRHANRVGAELALIVGERELADGVVELRDLAASEQRQVALADVVGELTST